MTNKKLLNRLDEKMEMEPERIFFQIKQTWGECTPSDTLTTEQFERILALLPGVESALLRADRAALLGAAFLAANYSKNSNSSNEEQLRKFVQGIADSRPDEPQRYYGKHPGMSEAHGMELQEFYFSRNAARFLDSLK